MEDLEENYYWETADKNQIKGNWVDINKGKNEFARRVLTYPRIWMIILNTACLYLFYHIIRKEFNTTTAIAATVIMAFSPTFLAHSRLITTGVPVMWAIFFGTFALYKYLKAKPDNKRKAYIIFIAATAFALQVKFTATLVAVIWLASIFVYDYLKHKEEKFIARVWQAAKKPLLTAALWALILFVMYGFQIRTLKSMTYGAEWRIEGNTENLRTMGEYINKVIPWDTNDDMIIWAYENIPVPFPQYINGFIENVVIHNYFWYGKYIFGRFLGPGDNIPYYFPVAYSVKETIPTVLLTVVTLGTAVYLFIKRKLNFKKLIEKYNVLIVVPIFITILLLNSSINLGVRHLLPLYPYLFIALGLTVHYFYSKLNKKVVLGVTVISLIFALGSIIRVHPDLIAYYNEIAGGPEKGWWVVRGTNFDWNQDDGFAEKYAEENDAVFEAENLPDEGEGLYIARVKRLYSNHPSEELANLRELYEEGNIDRVDNIHHTYWVFQVRKDQLIDEESIENQDNGTETEVESESEREDTD
jgi:4-amino-4-deoxy-L-arabinose transferase-like glycosyltransferase